MLTIVPVPIGNLKDITLRALESLKTCDLVLCEDSRKTGFLLHHFDITKKMIPFHMHNELKLEKMVIDHLKEGKNICLVSDAGTPSINDPGAALISACHKAGIPVSALPGPSSVVTALSLSGLKYDKFQFLGFFPKKNGERLLLIKDMLQYDGVSIFFESPNRIVKIIALFPESAEILIAKELTKVHEALITLTPKDAAQYEDRLSKGEICVMVQGKKKEGPLIDKDDAALMKLLTNYLSTKDASKIAAELTGKKKQHFYQITSER
ncbi:MAG: Ribosomal RNA small subunit methyltransferase I [Chlamydiia bacterium]|nr:Ribosomal RNA small subunit methyltransferase I [Chlamydiia bacterium]MCH9619020.1 Ribosomal RNA small subunit methyltransferase I [Chlamydiia bacterium]MCH9624043.1 Ribosomal RNA small subunit methyltransferase I [Chlamydiia bacterium]